MLSVSTKYHLQQPAHAAPPTPSKSMMCPSTESVSADRLIDIRELQSSVISPCDADVYEHTVTYCGMLVIDEHHKADIVREPPTAVTPSEHDVSVDPGDKISNMHGKPIRIQPEV